MTETKLYQKSAIDLTGHRRSLKALTGIRFVAAAYVVVYHTKIGSTLEERGQLAAGDFFMSGYLAVSLFFLLSGFILAYTYSGQISGAGDHRRFWEARFARIWPVYAVSLALTSAVHLAFPKPSFMLATLLMLQAWNPFDRAMWGAWNYVCWTLSVEAFFYLVFPWYQQWVEKLSRRLQLAAIVSMLAAALFLNSGVYVLGYESHGILHLIPFPLIRLPEFLAGVGLGNYYMGTISLEVVKPSGVSSSAPGLWTYVSALLAIALLCRARNASTSLVLAAFAAMVYGLAIEKTLLSRFLSHRFLILGGSISYSIYLLQAPVKDMVMIISDRLHIESLAFRMAFMIVFLIVLSAMSFKTVEEPARRRLRSLFAHLEEKRTIAKRRGIAVKA